MSEQQLREMLAKELEIYGPKDTAEHIRQGNDAGWATACLAAMRAAYDAGCASTTAPKP